MTARTVIGLSIALFMGMMSVSRAQSSYTTGTLASSARAGYGTAYGGGRLFAYAPGHGRAHWVRSH